MHDPKWIKNNKEKFDKAMSDRGLAPVSDTILQLDESKRQIVTLLQQLQQARNEKAKMIAQLSGQNSEEIQTIKNDASDIKHKIYELEAKLNDDELDKFLSSLPNIPADDVPVGKDETANKEIKKFMEPTKFTFTPKPHYELGEQSGMLDFVDSSNMSGSRFVTLRSNLAKLERVLVNFMIDIHTQKFGFTEISPPYLVRDEAMYNAGQLPKFAEESYAVSDGLRLIPTAEVPLINFFANKIVELKDLPVRYVAHTPCFRSEAGAAGKDTRGMIRVHQFQKVELVSITSEDESDNEHEFILKAAETILQELELPYRVMILSTGDMGFCARKTYDIEVWLPGQNCYREISSCSNCGDFQGRRSKARYREGKENKFLHMLNGSGLAIGRTIVAILENYQNEDGSITIPKKLVPYMNCERI